MRHLTASLLNINLAQLTMDVLDKLACLSRPAWAIQLILVDNGSQPDQLALLLDWFTAHKDQFEEILFVTASRNLGATGGRNLAFKLASGQHILILDNDIILPADPAWLDILWQKLEDDPHLGIVGPMLVFADLPDVVQATGVGLTDRGRVGYLNRGEPVDRISSGLIQVVASPSACWLVRREAQQSVGLLSDEYYPVQYEDIDLCVRLGLAGWKIACECSVRVRHIENVTTRNLKDYPFARLTVRQGMIFREKWADVLPQIATLTDQDIYWGPIPRVRD